MKINIHFPPNLLIQSKTVWVFFCQLEVCSILSSCINDGSCKICTFNWIKQVKAWVPVNHPRCAKFLIFVELFSFLQLSCPYLTSWQLFRATHLYHVFLKHPFRCHRNSSLLFSTLFHQLTYCLINIFLSAIVFIMAWTDLEMNTVDSS